MVNHLPSGWRNTSGSLSKLTGLNGATTSFVDRIDGRGGEVIGGVGLRAVARLVERHHGRGRAEIVVGHLDRGIALLEGRELRRPIGPGRAGVERHDHAFLAGGLIQRLLARIELGRIHHGLRVRACASSSGQRQRPRSMFYVAASWWFLSLALRLIVVAAEAGSMRAECGSPTIVAASRRSRPAASRRRDWQVEPAKAAEKAVARDRRRKAVDRRRPRAPSAHAPRAAPAP